VSLFESRVRVLSVEAGCEAGVVAGAGVTITDGAGVAGTGVDAVPPPTGAVGCEYVGAGIGLSLSPFGLSRVEPSVRGRFPFAGVDVGAGVVITVTGGTHQGFVG